MPQPGPTWTCLGAVVPWGLLGGEVVNASFDTKN